MFDILLNTTNRQNLLRDSTVAQTRFRKWTRAAQDDWGKV